MRKYSVILADDDEGVRQRVTMMLAADYEIVASVENGQELVEAARTRCPDLIIVDISMPVLNGLEAVKQLRTQGIEAKIVFLTTNSNPAYVRRALQNGATGYVFKGSGIEEELPGALTAVLDGRTFVSPRIQYTGPPPP